MAEKPSSPEKTRGTLWLVAAICAAKVGQLVLKQAHHDGIALLWPIGCVILAGMFFCMFRSWQYLYLGRKLPPSDPAPTSARKSGEQQSKKL